MSKCTIARLLKEEAYNLTLLANQLEDKSKLCFPGEYNCTECFNQIIRNLKKIRKQMNGVCYGDERKWIFF